MSEKADYYELLGVAKGAATGDIRKAYKKLALKYHPDRNKDPGAEDTFKAVTEAYSVLSDDDKRARYDRYGHAGVDGAAGFADGDIFSQFQDIFSDFFGGMGGGFPGGGRQQRRGPARGRDVRIEQHLTLEESFAGCKKEIELHTPISCNECEGTGAEDGSAMKTCGVCGGQGQVSTARGFIMFSQPCGNCQGSGRVIETPCDACDGAGWQERARTVTVSFPAGIDEGHRLRVSGQGLPGAHGGPAGNLYVDVIMAPQDDFEREGNDLIAQRSVSFPGATLGTALEIELLDGTVHKLDVKAGTQPGAVLSAPGLGMPAVNGRGRGALHVIIQVDVPKKLSRKAKKLLRQLAEELV